MNVTDPRDSRKLDDVELWHQLSNAIHSRSSADQVLWTMSGIIWAANALLLVALFQGGKLPDSDVASLVISAVGTLLSVMQFFLQGRGLAHIKIYEALIKRLESTLAFSSEYALSPDLNVAEADYYEGGSLVHRLRMGTLFPVRKLMQFTSVAGALLWLAAVGFFLYRMTDGTTLLS